MNTSQKPYVVISSEKNMERHKAELVHTFTAEVLQPGWTPTISQEELDNANVRLEACHNQYRWRWRQKMSSLRGSVTMQDLTHNVVAA